jgi:hypothetical protein
VRNKRRLLLGKELHRQLHLRQLILPQLLRLTKKIVLTWIRIQNRMTSHSILILLRWTMMRTQHIFHSTIPGV